MKKLLACILAAGIGLLANTAQATDETPALDNLMGMPGVFMQGLRDTFGKVHLTIRVDDLSTTRPAVVVSPVAGKITLIRAIALASVTNGISVTAEQLTNITGRINGAAITNGAMTVSSNTANPTFGDNSRPSNDVMTAVTPTAANTVAVGDVIRFDNDNGHTEDIDLVIIIEIDRDDL